MRRATRAHRGGIRRSRFVNLDNLRRGGKTAMLGGDGCGYGGILRKRCVRAGASAFAAHAVQLVEAPATVQLAVQWAPLLYAGRVQLRD